MIWRSIGKFSLLAAILFSYSLLSAPLPLNLVWQGLLLAMLPVSLVLFWLGNFRTADGDLLRQLSVYVFGLSLLLFAVAWPIGTLSVWLYTPFGVTAAHTVFFLLQSVCVSAGGGGTGNGAAPSSGH